MRKLKELRKQYGMTQAELSAMLGVANSTLSLYEKGVHEPDIETIKKIADIFGVSLDALLDRKSESNPEEPDEAWLIRERLRRDPDYRILFSAASNAKPEHLRAAAAVLQSLKGGDADD